MNITKFFDLSIHEVEEYIKSRITLDNLTSSTNLAECLGLTGFNNYVFGKLGEIRVVKKSNLYRVYYTHVIRTEIFEESKFLIAFNMSHTSYFKSFLIGVEPETLEIISIKYDGRTYLELDKTKRLREFLYEHYQIF